MHRGTAHVNGDWVEEEDGVVLGHTDQCRSLNDNKRQVLDEIRQWVEEEEYGIDLGLSIYMPVMK